MGGACSTYGGKERYIQDFGGGGVPRECVHVGVPGAGGRIILKRIFKT
jgi:hypothetical protein